MTLPANLQGIVLMVLGMLGFAVADVFLKLLGGAIPTGQIIMSIGAGAGTIFLVAALREGQLEWVGAFKEPIIIWRNLFEIIGTLGFLTALILAPLSTVSAIIQANPLIVTFGAALWLKEPVGPYRWAAIFVGLLGVLLVIQPWGTRFEPTSLFAIIAVLGLALRDLATRRVPKYVSTKQLSVYALYLLIPAGALLMLATGSSYVIPNGAQAVFLISAIFISSIGYFGTTAAMRVGDVGVVTPFRYSRIVFALIFAALVFDESPDVLTYLGAAIIVASGIFTLWREQRAKVAAG
ncbi:MAG: DMT family transporter [Aliishimia sp.]